MQYGEPLTRLQYFVDPTYPEWDDIQVGLEFVIIWQESVFTQYTIPYIRMRYVEQPNHEAMQVNEHFRLLVLPMVL